jgi:hypothetical protein
MMLVSKLVLHTSRTKRRKVPVPEGVITTTEILQPEEVVEDTVVPEKEEDEK